MLQVHDLMHKVWKSQVEEKSLQSSISNWVMNLPFDTKIKEWLAAEEKYQQEMQMNNILPVVADKFLVDEQGHKKGARVLCFDEIQVRQLMFCEPSVLVTDRVVANFKFLVM